MLTIFQMIVSVFGLVVFLALSLIAILLAFFVFALIYGLVSSVVDAFNQD